MIYLYPLTIQSILGSVCPAVKYAHRAERRPDKLEANKQVNGQLQISIFWAPEWSYKCASIQNGEVGKKNFVSVLFPYFNVCGKYYLTEAGAWALSLMMKLVADWLRTLLLPCDWPHLTIDDRAKKSCKRIFKWDRVRTKRTGQDTQKYIQYNH